MSARNALALAIPKVTSPCRTKSDKDRDARLFRAEVWRRADGRDRATGEPLSKSDPNWRFRGEVCHLKGRRVRPDWLTDPDHAILLSAEHHWLSDARGNRRLKLYDPDTLDPATDATKPIVCVMTDGKGHVLWLRLTNGQGQRLPLSKSMADRFVLRARR